MMGQKKQLSEVSAFWNTEACGTHFVKEATTERDFFERFRDHRYRTEWHIPLLVPFAEAKGKEVLEIGTGNGADAVMFALNGANYTGVDLTDAALEATQRHFTVLGLTGKFQHEDAERLSFPSESFDWVYSHGVLHHTPDTQRAIDEVWRVLRPRGKAIIMLYHKHSFNYFVRIMIYMRLHVLVKILSRLGKWKHDRRTANSAQIVGLRGNEHRQVWEIHYRNFLRDGWSYLRARNFVHHCTDGPECPVAFAFSKKEARQLFAKFRNVTFRVAHFPLRRYGCYFPFAVEKALAETLGWYLFIFATK
jgi:ubiquinone/menaquinone biosynthesis C-methylase UbiE